MIVIGYELVSYLLHHPSARCVTFKELFVTSKYKVMNYSHFVGLDVGKKLSMHH